MRPRDLVGLSGAARTSRNALSAAYEIARLRQHGRTYLRALPAFLGLALVGYLAESLSVALAVLFLQGALGDTGGLEADSWLAGLEQAVGNLTGGGLLPLGGLVVLSLLVRIAADLATGWADSVIYGRVADQLRRAVHAQYLDVSYGYIQRFDHASLLNVLENEAEQAAETFQDLKGLLTSAVAVTIFAGALALISWKLLAMTIVGGVLLLVLSRLLAQPIERLSAAEIRRASQLIRAALVTLQGLRTLRAFAQEAAEKARFARVSDRLRDIRLKWDLRQTLIDPIHELSYLAVVVAIALGALAAGVPMPALVAGLAMLYRLEPHVRDFVGSLMNILTAAPHLALVREILQPADAAPPSPGHAAFSQVSEAVRFEAVSFTYPGAAAPSLIDASFEIPAGRLTALVGESGSGKTTAINLLLRLYEPSAGRILVNGQDLAALRRADWLGRIALAGQDAEVVEGTIATNIRLSRPDAAPADLRWAAAMAGADDFIDALPDGYGSWVGERGLRLSGGQRQRIGLARAFLRRPDLLILDEAGSALDEASELRIRRNIQAHGLARTILVVTHRLHTVMDADHAVWLQRGRVVAQGLPGSLELLRRRSAQA